MSSDFKTDSKDVRTQILDISEQMFVKYGYSGTTFQKIADELGIAKSTITYHFKSKCLLIEELIDIFFAALKDYIDSFPEDYRNCYWRHCTLYIYAYRRIMSSPRCMELFYHKDQQECWQHHKTQMVSLIYERIEKDFHKPYDMKDLRFKVTLDMGARARLYAFYTENPGIMTLDQYCYYHIYLLGILCKLDEETIQENIRLAFAFADSHEAPLHGIFR